MISSRHAGNIPSIAGEENSLNGQTFNSLFTVHQYHLNKLASCTGLQAPDLRMSGIDGGLASIKSVTSFLKEVGEFSHHTDKTANLLRSYETDLTRQLDGMKKKCGFVEWFCKHTNSKQVRSLLVSTSFYLESKSLGPDPDRLQSAADQVFKFGTRKDSQQLLEQCDESTAIEALLKAGIDPNRVDKEGNTLLIRELKKLSLETGLLKAGKAIALLEHATGSNKTDVNKYNRAGETALSIMPSLICPEQESSEQESSENEIGK